MEALLELGKRDITSFYIDKWGSRAIFKIDCPIVITFGVCCFCSESVL